MQLFETLFMTADNFLIAEPKRDENSVLGFYVKFMYIENL